MLRITSISSPPAMMALQQRRKQSKQTEQTEQTACGDEPQRARQLPQTMRLLGCEVERNAVLAALGAVAATSTILGFQYVCYSYFFAPAPLEEGDLPFIN